MGDAQVGRGGGGKSIWESSLSFFRPDLYVSPAPTSLPSTTCFLFFPVDLISPRHRRRTLLLFLSLFSFGLDLLFFLYFSESLLSRLSHSFYGYCSFFCSPLIYIEEYRNKWEKHRKDINFLHSIPYTFLFIYVTLSVYAFDI